MRQLEEYCMEIRPIGGVETYIVDPEFCGDIASDDLLLSSLSASPKFIKYYIKCSEHVKTSEFSMYLAFIHSGSRIERFSWLPLNCLKHGEDYYHVVVRDTWMCRNCGHIHRGIIIMPMAECDTTVYPIRSLMPPVPGIFKKKACECCGRLLQNHLIILDREMV